MGEHRLLEWAGKQLDWVRDAVRRHAQSPGFELGAADKEAIVARVRQAAGFDPDVAHDHKPLAQEHLSFGGAPTSKAVLASLGPVKNLAKLAPDQQLRFAVNGITLVYGDNASGKSSYCRVTKNVCHSQTTDELLGDVFEAGVKPPPEVLIRYRTEGSEEVTETTWQYGSPPPEELGAIAVFDSQNARFYIDKQNRVEFLPAEISLLESHAAHCREMRSSFEGKRKVLENQIAVPLPGGFTPSGAVAQALAKLALKVSKRPTKDELTALAAWGPDEEVELAELSQQLAQDPSALAARDQRSKSVLGSYVDLLPAIEIGLGSQAKTSLEAKVDAVKSANAAAALAAEDSFALDPLPGVGEHPWREMYEHAKAFVVANGISQELPANEGDLCALCQQPLDAEASDRLKRFAAFVSGEVAKRQTDAANSLAEALKELEAIAIPTQALISQALAEYRAIDAKKEAFATKIEAYFGSARARRDGLKAAVASENFDNLPDLSASISTALTAERDAMQDSATAFQDQAKADTQRAKLIERQNELKDRQGLHNALETVLARLADLEKHDQLCKCEQLVGIQQLSTFITSYRRDLFTDGLQERIQSEIDALDLGHIPFVVSDQSKDGSSLFKVGLLSASPIDNQKVLSEGEQRALALACFLAEAGGDEAQNGLIVDDPVSSLDHLRIRKVAKRLVSEAGKGRQLIIFTHNLLFYNEVLQAAADETPQVPVARRVVSKSQAKGFGLISEEAEPWSARKITSRIADLRTRRNELAAKFTDFDTDGYRRAAKDFYTDLRETWERLVEELLLGKVVERYSSDVRTQSLKLVEVEDDDYKTIFFAMKKVSERSGHDMPAGKQIAIPTPDDMKSDVDEIEAYRAVLAKRKNATSERREALEKPPAPELA